MVTIGLLLLSHVAAVALGALMSYRFAVRNLTVCEVEGHAMIGIERNRRPSTNTVSTIALFAALIVIVIGAQSLAATNEVIDNYTDTVSDIDTNTGDIKANNRRIETLQNVVITSVCGNAVLLLSLLDQPRDPDLPPPTRQEQGIIDQFRAEYERQIKDLNCAKEGLS